MRLHKYITNQFFQKNVISLCLLILCCSICLYPYVSSSQDEIQESYDAIMLDERFIDIGSYSSDVVFETSKATLEHFKYLVYRADKEDGIIISRVHKFRINTYRGGRSPGGDFRTPSSSSPAHGNHYFLILKITKDDEGKNALHCMIAKPLKHWGDRIAGKVLKQFVVELQSNLDKLL